MKISTGAVEASLSNLWKNCWEVAAEPMVRGLPGTGCFLISCVFSITCTPVYRLRRNSCARSFRRYPRFVLTLLCATCGKLHRSPAGRGAREPARKMISCGCKELIHRRFSAASGAAGNFPQSLWGEARRRCGQPVTRSREGARGVPSSSPYVF